MGCFKVRGGDVWITIKSWTNALFASVKSYTRTLLPTHQDDRSSHQCLYIAITKTNKELTGVNSLTSPVNE